MRLYPPPGSATAWRGGRCVYGYSYPKGTILILFYYGLHRSKGPLETPPPLSLTGYLQLPNRYRSGDKRKKGIPLEGAKDFASENFAMAEMAICISEFIYIALTLGAPRNSTTDQSAGYAPTRRRRAALKRGLSSDNAFLQFITTRAVRIEMKIPPIGGLAICICHVLFSTAQR